MLSPVVIYHRGVLYPLPSDFNGWLASVHEKFCNYADIAKHWTYFLSDAKFFPGNIAEECWHGFSSSFFKATDNMVSMVLTFVNIRFDIIIPISQNF